ncbi:hypothetical protein AB0G15_34265 [Streptosporangium sp. NPDC023825]|uniref:hypothetical protein n=1 Tax=Streptosporangium sp. NPDC023825 TaxID=3154909 RepID=UPI0034372B07
MTTSTTPVAVMTVTVPEGTFARVSAGVPVAVSAAAGPARVPVVTVATASAVTSAGEAA